MIQIEQLNIAKRLTDINLRLPQGKLIGIMGANGAGKSTLLKAIAGILPITSGQIWLGKRPLSEMNAQAKSEALSYLAQSTDIYWDLTVDDVIALGLAQGLHKAKAEEKIEQIAQKFQISHLLKQSFQTLSGGEKARVQLARCTIKESPILLADEPIAALDPYYQIDIMEQLKALSVQHTVIIAIHHLSLAYQFCDEVVLLKQGKMITNGETSSVITEENLAKVFDIQAKIDKENREIVRIKKTSI